MTEARERVGGNITSVSNSEGYLWEEGPNSFQPNDSMLKAAVDSKVADKLVFGDPTAPRFVFWEGRLRPTPSGPDVLTFDLMSILGKIRAGLGAAGFKAPMPGARGRRRRRARGPPTCFTEQRRCLQPFSLPPHPLYTCALHRQH